MNLLWADFPSKRFFVGVEPISGLLSSELSGEQPVAAALPTGVKFARVGADPPM